MIFYYSGCGNSKHVAEQLAQTLNEQLIFIPEASRNQQFQYTISPTDRIGFVFPVYSWSVPNVVIDFVKKLTINGSPNYIFMVCTCGVECGYTKNIFEKLLAQKSWKLSAAFSLQMPETYVNMRGFKLDAPDVAARKIVRADAELTQIADDILYWRHKTRLLVGKLPFIKSYLICALFNRHVSDKPFHANSDCTNCGLCQKVCPLQNITMENGRPKWNGNCTNCNACYHHCSTNAIHFGKVTHGLGQYYFGRKPKL